MSKDLPQLFSKDQVLEALIDEMQKATERAEKAIDEALEFVAASNKRIAEMEASNKTNF